MRITIIGGGPSGLYFAVLMKKLDPGHEIVVYERNAAHDTFGFGVVFSDETLDTLAAADGTSFDQIAASFVRWSDVAVDFRGTYVRSGGHGFAAIQRKKLLNVLQSRAQKLGVDVRFCTEAPDLSELADQDLVVAADGVNSVTRSSNPQWFGPSIERRHAKYMWLGTTRVFDAITFYFVETPYGVMEIHAYPFSDEMSTFIVEMPEQTWINAGFSHSSEIQLPPGVSDVESISRCETLLAHVLDGHELVGNNSKWLNFHTVRNERWSHDNVVLMGDAAHTAHYSIGSGTKIAMEDAISLAWAFTQHPDDVPRAIAAFELERRPIVASTQRSAQASLEWYEGVARYMAQDPRQFAFNLLTRSRRVTHENLKLRDAKFVADVERLFAETSETTDDETRDVAGRPPMFAPFGLRDVTLPNRIVVSSMEMASAEDGLVGDFHLVHLGSRVIGGAGLVMTEMTAVSPSGRTTPGAAGLYDDRHVAAWQRITDFAHQHGGGAIGVQLGHAGRKAATKLPWLGQDEPLNSDAWPIVAPSPIPYTATHQVPRELTRTDMDAIRDEFVDATVRAAEAGFDLVELHFAHGYLLSSFLSPLTNQRTDEYGGTLEHRARFPLEVFDACRAVWPSSKPMAVRISATDWVPGGFDDDQAVALAALLKDHECDLIDVSTGQVSPEQKPAYGRSFQTPFADRIRNEVGIATMAVGAISSFDDVNSILLAGRADLCALGRPHIYDPYWTLHAAAEQEWTEGIRWLNQYLQGRRRPPAGRTDAARMPARTFDEVSRPGTSRASR